MKVSHIFTGIFLGLLFCSFFGTTSCRKGNKRKKDHPRKRDGPLTSAIDTSAHSDRVVLGDLKTDRRTTTDESEIKKKTLPLCGSGDLDCLKRRAKKARMTHRRKTRHRQRNSDQREAENHRDRQKSRNKKRENKISLDKDRTHKSSSNIRNSDDKSHNNEKGKSNERPSDIKGPERRKSVDDQQPRRNRAPKKDHRNIKHEERVPNRHKNQSGITISGKTVKPQSAGYLDSRRGTERKSPSVQASARHSQRERYGVKLAHKRDETDKASSKQADASTREPKRKGKDNRKRAKNTDSVKSATNTRISVKINEADSHERKVDNSKIKTKNSKNRNARKRGNGQSEQQNDDLGKKRTMGNGHPYAHSKGRESKATPRKGRESKATPSKGRESKASPSSGRGHKSEARRKKASKASGRKDISDKDDLFDKRPKGRVDRYDGRRTIDYRTRRFNARRNYDRRPIARGRARYDYDYGEDYGDYDYDYDVDYEEYDARSSKRGPKGDEGGRRRPSSGQGRLRPRPYYGRPGRRGRRYPPRGLPRRPYYRPARRRRPTTPRRNSHKKSGERKEAGRGSKEISPIKTNKKERKRPKKNQDGDAAPQTKHGNDNIRNKNGKSGKSKSAGVTPITPYAFTTDQLQGRKPPKQEMKGKTDTSDKEGKPIRTKQIDQSVPVTDSKAAERKNFQKIKLETRKKVTVGTVQRQKISKPHVHKMEKPTSKVITKLTKVEPNKNKNIDHKERDQVLKEQDRPRAQPSNRRIFINPLIPKSRARDRASMEAHRLRSKVAQLSDQILISMERVLKALRSKVNTAYGTYHGMFNRTRYDIMLGVRKGLYSVVNTNDEIYGIVLDMSRLVRRVYRRAHERNLFDHSSRRRPLQPNIYNKNFRPARRKADQEYNSAMYTINKTKRQKRRCRKVMSRKDDLKSRLMKLQAHYRLRELAYFSNRTLRQVQNVIAYNMAKRKLVYFGDTMKIARGLMVDARNTNRMAHDLVTECTMKGWKCSEAFKHAKEKFKRAKERYTQQVRPEPQPTISPEERRQLRRIIDQAKQHAFELDYMKQLVERLIYPSLRRLRALIEYRKRGGQLGGGSSSGRGPATSSPRIARILQDVTQKIQTALQKLKVKIAYDPYVRPGDCEVGSGDDDEEGTGCDEGIGGSGEGGGGIGGGTPTNPEENENDFIFEERESPRPKEKDQTPFGVQLQRYTTKLRGRSERLKEQAMRLARTVSKRRNSVRRLAGAERVFNEAADLLRQWRNDQPDYREKHQRVFDSADRINFLHKRTQSKSLKAVRIVEKKLEEVTKGGGEGGGAFAEAIQSVGKAQSNVKSIQELTTINPDPCARATLHRDNIRSNLTELRNKIERVRFLTASMKLPVALSEGNYLEVPMTHAPIQSHVASFEFCVKRTSSDGIVAVIPGNNSVTISVAVEDGFLSSSVTDKDGDSLATLKSPSKLKTDQWYKVRIRRYGQKIMMTVHARGETALSDTDTSQSEITLQGQNSVQLLPSRIFIGGRPGKVKKVKHFTGCVSEVRFNGRDVNVYVPDRNGQSPSLCSSACVSKSSMVFDGSGYLLFPPKLYPMTSLLRSVNLVFRTLQRNALLLLLGAQKVDLYLIASIEKGFVVVSLTSAGRTTSIRTTDRSYADGQFYTLMISLAGRLTATIDGEEDTFTPENSAEFLTKYKLNHLLIGGMPENSQTYLKRNMSSFSGCIEKIELNEEEIEVSSLRDSKGVYTGSCQDSIVSSCVSFTAKSKVIVLPKYNHSNSVHFMFKTHELEAKGYLLNYKRGEKVDLWLRLTTSGIETRETVEDKDELISVKNIGDGHWHNLILTQVEGEERLVVSIDGGKPQEIDYDPGFWGQKKPDGSVSITIGGTPADEEGKGFRFEGNIAHFHIENRPVDLTRYTMSNNLDGCRTTSPPSVQSNLVGDASEKVC